ncbi:MAG TPA: baseplate J/gp47 family protein, partial [Ktedonobacteraceae bacterium]|nr:baseplate J/gp47 family protein [Ktedonobacteraceae bacterium]
WLHTVIPAAAATVSITPAKTDFSHTYTLMVTTGATGYNGGNVSVQGRQVSAKSPQEIQTVIATGRGLHPAIAAKGSVVVSQIHLTVISPTGNSLAVSSIPDGDGRSITTDEEVPISDGATVTIPAHATVAGSGGNLPAHDLDGPIQIVDAMNNSPIGTAYVANPAAFTGGQDATSYVFVQQSDIDNAAKAMTAQLTPGMKEQVQAQIHKDDLLVHAIACTSDTGADHKANDEAANVTVKVTVSCNTLVYTAQTLHDAAVKAYQSDGSARFGSGYGVVGDIVAGKPAPADEGVFTMQIDGIWSYQYTQAHLQEIKSLIAGKKSGDALKLLQARKDIQHVSLTTSGGLGTAVPTALDNIQLHVATVTGLHA